MDIQIALSCFAFTTIVSAVWHTWCAAKVSLVAVTACRLLSVAMQLAEMLQCCKRSAREQETYPLPDPISTHLHAHTTGSQTLTALQGDTSRCSFLTYWQAELKGHSNSSCCRASTNAKLSCSRRALLDQLKPALAVGQHDLTSEGS